MGQDVRYFQGLVDQTVRKLGGYWRPLSGLARLLEELGELGEVIVKSNFNIEELGEELADLFIITISIANQYCADLNNELKLLGYPITIEKLYKVISPSFDSHLGFLQLSIGSGQIARILNHYEGDKKKKATEEKQRLAKEIAKFHVDLIGFANLYHIPLFFTIQKVLNRDAERDKGRFEITHDPTTEPAIEHFYSIVPEMGVAPMKIWGSYEWDDLKTLEGNLENSLPSFKRFVKVAEPEGLEGFVLEIIGENYIKDIEKRNDTIKRVFTFLNRHDTLNMNEEENFGFTVDFMISFQGHQLEWSPLLSGTSLFILFQPII